MEAIFANMLDIHSISVSFLSQLEDAMEMMNDNSSYTAIGECFEEIAEVKIKSIFVLSFLKVFGKIDRRSADSILFKKKH